MGQLERYGLYVLVVVIFLILGVAIWGGDPAAPREDLAVLGNGGRQGLRVADVPPPSRRIGDLFSDDHRDVFTQGPSQGAGPQGAERPDPGDLVAPVQPPVSSDVQDGPGPASTPTPASAPAVARTHVIVSGDSLSALSERYYGTQSRWQQIADANPGLDANRLKLGAELTIPVLAEEAARRAGPVQTTESGLAAGHRIHVVTKGDMLARLAKRYYGADKESEWRRIKEANPGVDPRRMPEGTRLTIPPLD